MRPVKALTRGPNADAGSSQTDSVAASNDLLDPCELLATDEAQSAAGEDFGNGELMESISHETMAVCELPHYTIAGTTDSCESAAIT